MVSLRAALLRMRICLFPVNALLWSGNEFLSDFAGSTEAIHQSSPQVQSTDPVQRLYTARFSRVIAVMISQLQKILGLPPFPGVVHQTIEMVDSLGEIL